jgi:hypothetical protein
MIATELKGPGGLTCPLDVVAGGKSPREAVVPESGTALAQRLRGWDDKIWCGSQVSSSRSDKVSWGTLGAFVRRTTDGTLGFITCEHVAVGVGFYHPWAPGSPLFPSGTRAIGRRQETVVERPVAEWYGAFAAEADDPSAAVRVDCAFVSTSLTAAEVQPEPLIDCAPLDKMPVTSVFEVDLKADMTDEKKYVIGREVYHVGRTTGVRRGEIAAFAYEWEDQPGHTRYTDLLIKGESQFIATGVEMSVPFSYKGDSGSVIFTVVNGEKRPIALLWGGYQEQLRGGESQENWSYATRLDRALAELKLTLVTSAADFGE